MKNMDAQKPINKDMYATNLYYNFLFDIVENTISPIPSTVKLLINVKRLRRLFNLS